MSRLCVIPCVLLLLPLVDGLLGLSATRPTNLQLTLRPAVRPVAVVSWRDKATRLHGSPVAAEDVVSSSTAWGSLVPVLTGTMSLGGIVVADVALRRLFVARAIPFPSSLAGMLLLCALLCGLQTSVPSVAAAIAAAAAPGCALISRWLAVFFVPNLVVLPLVLNFSLAEGMRLALVILGGLAASLSLAGLSAAAMVDDSNDVNGSPPPSSSVSAAATSTLNQNPLLPWGAACVCSGALALGAYRMGALAFAPALASAHFFLVTLGGFVAGGLLPATTRKVLHPLISTTFITIGAIAAFAGATAQPFRLVLRSYLTPGGAALSAPGNVLLAMLGPATLSFGFGMFERRQLIRKSARALSVVLALSSTFGLFATALAGRALQLYMPLRLAALPRQVTAPLAIAIAGMIGADPSLAATIVVITGLLAANFGAAALDLMGVRSPVARGLAMGAAGHGLGTAAMAQEKEAFPFAAIAMALNAALSTVLVSVPPVRKLLLAAAGATMP